MVTWSLQHVALKRYPHALLLLLVPPPPTHAHTTVRTREAGAAAAADSRAGPRMCERDVTDGETRFRGAVTKRRRNAARCRASSVVGCLAVGRGCAAGPPRTKAKTLVRRQW